MMATKGEICWTSAFDLAELVRQKKLSPIEIVKRFLECIDRINPKINAYVTVCAEQALTDAAAAEQAVVQGEALGPLHGVPFCVKDVTFTRGVRTTMGSKLRENFVPSEDAVLVARLKKAGGIMIGKTNTPEFATIPYTENALFGVTRNPWNMDRAVGGSSGGAAAAVAAGLCPLATGNDAGGSIRIPASCCGVVGIKPQYGRVPSYPIFHQWESINHEGPITRTVRDAALMLDIMAGPHWGDRFSLPKHKSFLNALEGDIAGLKAGWSPDLGYAKVGEEVKRHSEDAIRKFSDLGLQVEEAAPEIGKQEQTYLTIINAELAAMMSLFGPIEQIRNHLEPQLAERIEQAQTITTDDYLKAGFARRELSARVGEFFTRYDLLLTPTIGVTAWPIGLPGRIVDEVDGEMVSSRDWLLTYPFNLSGHPAVTVPIGFSSEGLPVGLQIVGPASNEATVLRVAAAYEAAYPWADKTPSI